MENQTIVLNGLTLDPRVQAILPVLELPREELMRSGVWFDSLNLSHVSQASDEHPWARHTFVYNLQRGDEDMCVRITYAPFDEDDDTGEIFYDVEIQTFSDTNNVMESAFAALDAVRYHKEMGHAVLDAKA